MDTPNYILATFMKFNNVPMTEHGAIAEGWKKTDTKSCDEHSFFVGNRYMKDNESGRMALYDRNGVIAGIQSAFPSTATLPSSYLSMFPLENGKRHATAYFNHPSTICKAPSIPSGCVGNQLYIQNGSTPQHLYRVPLQESGMKGTNWKFGKCFYQMGNHYWHNISSNMDCNNFFPVFLLYNGGKLNAFGWALGGDAQDKNFEHPERAYLKYFFQDTNKPKCLENFSMRSTLHIYLQSSSLKYFC
eukprot:gene2681-889_t